MRRILKKIVANGKMEEKDFGDVSTLVNPDVVAQIAIVCHLDS